MAKATAYLPLVVILLGIGEGAKVLLVYLAIVPALALSRRLPKRRASRPGLPSSLR